MFPYLINGAALVLSVALAAEAGWGDGNDTNPWRLGARVFIAGAGVLAAMFMAMIRPI